MGEPRTKEAASSVVGNDETSFKLFDETQQTLISSNFRRLSEKLRRMKSSKEIPDSENATHETPLLCHFTGCSQTYDEADDLNRHYLTASLSPPIHISTFEFTDFQERRTLIQT